MKCTAYQHLSITIGTGITTIYSVESLLEKSLSARFFPTANLNSRPVLSPSIGMFLELALVFAPKVTLLYGFQDFDEELRLKTGRPSGSREVATSALEGSGEAFSIASASSGSRRRIYPRDILRPPVERPWFLSASQLKLRDSISVHPRSVSLLNRDGKHKSLDMASGGVNPREDVAAAMESGPSFLHPEFFSGSYRFGPPAPPAVFLRAFDVMVSTEASHWIIANSARVVIPSCITVEPFAGIPMQSPHWPTPVELEEAEGLLGDIARRQEATHLLLLDSKGGDLGNHSRCRRFLREAEPLGQLTHIPLVEAMAELCRWGFLTGKGPQTHLAVLHMLQHIVYHDVNGSRADSASFEAFGDLGPLFLSKDSVAAVFGMVATRPSRMQLPDKLGYEQFPLEGLPSCDSWEAHELFDRYVYTERRQPSALL